MSVRALQVRPWEWPAPFAVAGAPASRPLTPRRVTGFPAVGGGAPRGASGFSAVGSRVPPALGRLFSLLCEADALEAGRSQAVWAWVHRHGNAWRGGAPDVHAVDVAETPTVRAVEELAPTLGLDGEALVQAIADEVAGGVCLAETEALALQASAMPHAHPQTWVRALDPAAVTEAQVQAVVRGAIRNVLAARDDGPVQGFDAGRVDNADPVRRVIGDVCLPASAARGGGSLFAAASGDRAVQERLDRLLLPAASHALGRAALWDLRERLEARAGDGLFARTIAPYLSGQPVGDTADALYDALDAEAGLFDIVLQLGDGRRHAVLLSTQSTVNGPWFYDPNHLGFFCAQGASTRAFVRDFADYLQRMYREATAWHWITRLGA